MVNVMLNSMPQELQERLRGGAGGLAGTEQAGFPQQCQEGGGDKVLECQDRTHYPYKCIFWCAIALGALLQGCSSPFVSNPLLGTKPIADAVVSQCTNICVRQGQLVRI